MACDRTASEVKSLTLLHLLLLRIHFKTSTTSSFNTSLETTVDSFMDDDTDHVEAAAEYVATLEVPVIRELMRLVRFSYPRTSDNALALHFELNLHSQSLLVQRQVVEQVRLHQSCGNWSEVPISLPLTPVTSHNTPAGTVKFQRTAWRSGLHNGKPPPSAGQTTSVRQKAGRDVDWQDALELSCEPEPSSPRLPESSSLDTAPECDIGTPAVQPIMVEEPIDLTQDNDDDIHWLRRRRARAISQSSLSEAGGTPCPPAKRPRYGCLHLPTPTSTSEAARDVYVDPTASPACEPNVGNIDGDAHTTIEEDEQPSLDQTAQSSPCPRERRRVIHTGTVERNFNDFMVAMPEGEARHGRQPVSLKAHTGAIQSESKNERQRSFSISSSLRDLHDQELTANMDSDMLDFETPPPFDTFIDDDDHAGNDLSTGSQRHGYENQTIESCAQSPVPMSVHARYESPLFEPMEDVQLPTPPQTQGEVDGQIRVAETTRVAGSTGGEFSLQHTLMQGSTTKTGQQQETGQLRPQGRSQLSRPLRLEDLLAQRTSRARPSVENPSSVTFPNASTPERTTHLTRDHFQNAHTPFPDEATSSSRAAHNIALCPNHSVFEHYEYYSKAYQANICKFTKTQETLVGYVTQLREEVEMNREAEPEIESRFRQLERQSRQTREQGKELEAAMSQFGRDLQREKEARMREKKERDEELRAMRREMRKIRNERGARMTALEK
ncbi:hypothetical protein KVT40_008894 [Elsinoe batatas]|uniref:Uncharacterized protein n=1 Tax=Elsinoe batatas TaxID=2601811 RepID=A0A8K0L160_9PEZI|nr:hypothetical protein KVT40_008894 [Elsinoe batatas]